MKLSIDCIRAVMLEIEKSLTLSKMCDGSIVMDSLPFEEICDNLSNFTREDIFYAIFNLDQAGYINANIEWASGRVVYDCTVLYMTFPGHEFLDRIRDAKHWAIVKSGLSAIRNYSLDAINSIASGITTAAISAYFEKNSL